MSRNAAAMTAMGMLDSRELATVLARLKAPIPDELIKSRVGWTDRYGKEHRVDYVEWHTVADILDEVCPDWSYSLGKIEVVGNIVTMKASITILGVTREGIGTGPAGDEKGIKKAESDALKRAARMFGIGRELYKDDEDASKPATSGNSYSNQRPNFDEGPARSEYSPREPRPQAQGAPRKLITDKQKGAIYGASKGRNLDPKQVVLDRMGCTIDELSIQEASEILDFLNGKIK